MSGRRSALDICRVPAALLVAAIHCSPLLSYSAGADFVLTRVAARVAVPFFFMLTGYFVLGDVGKLASALKKTALVYLAAMLLYLPLNIYSGQLPGLRELLLDGTFYHLWYFPAVLTGLVITWGLSKLRGGVWLAAALYLLGLPGDSWFGLVRGLPWLAGVYEAIGYTRNGLFFAPLFLLMGSRARPGRGAEGLALAAAFAAMLAEALVLRRLGWQKHDSMYIMLPCVMYFLFRLLLGLRGAAPGWCADFSLLFYLLHPWCIVLVRGGAEVLGLEGPLVENSMGHFLAVLASSAAASWARRSSMFSLRSISFTFIRRVSEPRSFSSSFMVI